MTTPQAQQFGKYRIEAEIGRGGFGIVYRAVDSTLDRSIALKILDPMLSRDGKWVRQFRQEARVMAQLDHPHIVPIHETGEEGGRVYIAMKYIEGGSLADRIRQGPISWDATVRIVREIASALDFAHQRQIIHRDLKPGNILLGPNGSVLTDFGFARLIGDNSMSLSLSGGVVGTPAYIAPEIWEGKTVTAQVDIYALGCIVYEMVMGQILFAGDSAPAIMLSHFKPPVWPETWPQVVPAGLQEVLQVALSREPGGRYGQAGEMVHELVRLTSDTLREPYQALEKAVATAEWEQAIHYAGVVRARNPHYRDVQALEEKAILGRERSQREAWARQWQQQAEAALTKGDKDGARMAARRWQEMVPDDNRPQIFLADLERIDTDLKQSESVQIPKASPTGNSDPQATKLSMGSVKKTPPGRSRETKPVPSRTRNPKAWVMGIVVGVVVLALIAVALITAVALNELGYISSPMPTNPMPTNPMPTNPMPTNPMPTNTPVTGVTKERTIDGMIMIYVPSNTFGMGSYSSGQSDERPHHAVTLDSFWIDRTEVTNAMYSACVAAGQCEESEYADDSAYNGDNYPVVGVSWYDAQDYCQWVGGQLPTEAQWEYAARGTDGRLYPWGEETPTCERAQFNGCGGRTVAVGNLPAGNSWVEVADMAGNVWEWVADWYDSDYYDTSPSENPTGPTSGDYKVLRGGSWNSSPVYLRVAYRNYNNPGSRYADIGFRCVVPPGN